MDDFQTISLSNKRMLEPRRRASEDALCTRRRAPFWQRWRAFFWGIIFHGTHLGGSNHANGLTFWWISLTHSALFGLVILLSYKDPCFSICSSHVCWKTFEIWKPSNSSELEIPENGHLHRLKLSCFFFSTICHLNLQRRHFWRLGSKQRNGSQPTVLKVFINTVLHVKLPISSLWNRWSETGKPVAVCLEVQDT